MKKAVRLRTGIASPVYHLSCFSGEAVPWASGRPWLSPPPVLLAPLTGEEGGESPSQDSTTSGHSAPLCGPTTLRGYGAFPTATSPGLTAKGLPHSSPPESPRAASTCLHWCPSVEICAEGPKGPQPPGRGDPASDGSFRSRSRGIQYQFNSLLV